MATIVICDRPGCGARGARYTENITVSTILGEAGMKLDLCDACFRELAHARIDAESALYRKKEPFAAGGPA